MKAHIDKILLLAAIGFCAYAYLQGESIKGDVKKVVSNYQATKQNVNDALSGGEEITIPKPLKIDEKLKEAYSSKSLNEVKFSLPTSPTAGDETLPTVVFKEGSTFRYTPEIKDKNIDKYIGKRLNNPDLKISLNPTGIVKITEKRTRELVMKGLKRGKTTLRLRYRTFGAKVEIEVKQTVRPAVYLPLTTLKAVADKNVLNQVNLSWSPCLFSHPDALGGIKQYVLQRREHEYKGSGEWATIKTWPGAKAPVTFSDKTVEPGKSYSYRMKVSYSRVATIPEDQTWKETNLWNTKARDTKLIKNLDDDSLKGASDYKETDVLRIADGTAIIGFTRVIAGTPSVAIKKWYEGKWISALMDNTKGLMDSHKQLRPAKKDLEHYPVIGKESHKIRKPNDKGRLDLDFSTNYVMYYYVDFKAGDTIMTYIKDKHFKDAKKLKSISDDGKTFSRDTTLIWLIRKDDPFFTDDDAKATTIRVMFTESAEDVIRPEVSRINNLFNPPKKKPKPKPPVETPAPPEGPGGPDSGQNPPEAP